VNTTPQQDHKWNADRPGERPEDDKLGRNPFAQRIAKEVRGWRQKDSLVISLNGEWGSGKTTLANLILYDIDKQALAKGEAKPTVVRFNPWQWSGQDKLLEAFFDEIGTAFRSDKFADEATALKLARFWEGLKVVTIAGGELAKSLQETLVALAAMLAGGAGVFSSFIENPTGKAVFSWMGFGLLVLAGVCAVWAPLAEKLADLFKWRTEKPKLSLEEVRAGLRCELAKLKAPLLVVIDDIDRLAKSEMRLLVQLVKANADFPNVVYLLLYQKDVLAHALAGESSENGQDFLKKIVQVELEIPVAPDHEMRRIFREQIDLVLSRAQARWDKERWTNLFEEGIWPFFHTPRDIKRFRSALEFYFEAHIESGVLEVNPIDLILLEILRMFDPTAYEAVGRAFQKQRNLFLETLSYEKGAKDRLTIGIDELLKREELVSTEKERLAVLLYDLFPQAKDGFAISDRIEEEWKRDLRICHSHFFRRYFQLGGEPGDISSAFVSNLFKVGNDAAALKVMLGAALEKKLFTALMDRLQAARQDIPQSVIEPLITALFDLTDNLPDVGGDVLSIDAENQVIDLVMRLIRQIKNEDERSLVMRTAASAATALTGPVLCVSMLRQKEGDSRVTILSPIPTKELNDIKSDLLPKLWSVARSGGLLKMRKATALFYSLVEWAGENEVRQWLMEALQKPEAAKDFLRIMLDKSMTSGHRGTRTVYMLRPEQIERFTELEKLAEMVKMADKDPLEEAALQKLGIAICNKKVQKSKIPLYVLSKDESGHWLSDDSDLIMPL
jgi:predicted KAP-like P-loop ATPase